MTSVNFGTFLPVEGGARLKVITDLGIFTLSRTGRERGRPTCIIGVRIEPSVSNRDEVELFAPALTFVQRFVTEGEILLYGRCVGGEPGSFCADLGTVQKIFVNRHRVLASLS